MSVMVFHAPELANLALCAMGAGLAPRDAAAILADYSAANFRCFAANYSAESVAYFAPNGPATFDAILDAMIERMARGSSMQEAVATFRLLRYNLIGNEGEDFSTPAMLKSLIQIGESLSSLLVPA